MQENSSSQNKSIHSSRLIYIIFALLVFISVAGLDYINWKKDKRAYFFSTLSGEKKAALRQEALEQAVLNSFPLYGISAESVQQFRDTQGILHLMISLTSETYGKLESYLEAEFNKINVSILEKNEQLGEEKNYYLWQVGGKKEKGLVILFSTRKEEAQKPPLLQMETANTAAIIVDDMGYSLEAIQDICSFNAPLTVSIIPFSPFAQEVAQIAHQKGLEVILHLPLESINEGQENTIQGIIHSRMSEEEVRRTVETNLEQVPYIKGINNHMGSKITANDIFMNIILEILKKRGLFFIDSRTTTRSIAYEVAQKMKIPSAYRHVFLDGENDEDYIKQQLIELFRMARKNRKAVGICHPSETTLKVLRENLHLAEKYEVKLVSASQVVE